MDTNKDDATERNVDFPDATQFDAAVTELNCLVSQVHIGCKSKSVEEWDAWFAGAGEFDTPRDSEDFRRIRANYLAVKAYLIAMQEGAAQ